MSDPTNAGTDTTRPDVAATAGGEPELPDRWITDLRPSQRHPVYTRGNAGEVLPNPASPLAWTLVWEQGIAPGWRDCLVRVGTLTPDEIDVDEVIGLFGGYLYINGSVARLFGVRGPGLTPEMIDLTYFGEHPDVPPYVPEPWHERPESTARLAEWMGQVLLADDLPELRDDRDAADRARAERPDLRTIGEADLVERARSLVPLVRRLFDRHLEMTAGTSIGAGVLTQIAAAMGDPSMALELITGIGDVDSALPSQEMWALSRLDPDSDEYRAGLRDALDEYASRGPNEWDIRSDTWGTRPELATSLIDVMRKADDADAPEVRRRAGAERRELVTAQLRAALADQPETLAQFEAALHSAHLYMAGRERAKTNIIKVLHEIRLAVWELGARSGYTPSETCMLLADELDAFVAAPEEFAARLRQREEHYLALYDLDPPFIVNATVPPLPAWPRRTRGAEPAAAPGTVLRGVPGCPGTATGTARVILDPADPTALEPGEILVAPITDPAWTPLFVPAAAVVVDVGAQVSHAVIVSRELGIPCVVSVKDASRTIVDGTTITVDGSAGTVTIHEDERSAAATAGPPTGG